MSDMPEPAPTRPEETRLVVRGVKRYLRAGGFACVDEVPLASGRRADILALAEDGSIVIIEVKSSIEDFRADAKWHFYRQHCDRLFFATSPRVPQEIFPEDAGLIIADGFGAEMVRPAPEHRMPGATRKALTIRVGRLSALRLHRLVDPEAAS